MHVVVGIETEHPRFPAHVAKVLRGARRRLRCRAVKPRWHDARVASLGGHLAHQDVEHFLADLTPRQMPDEIGYTVHQSSGDIRSSFHDALADIAEAVPGP